MKEYVFDKMKIFVEYYYYYFILMQTKVMQTLNTTWLTKMVLYSNCIPFFHLQDEYVKTRNLAVILSVWINEIERQCKVWRLNWSWLRYCKRWFWSIKLKSEIGERNKREKDYDNTNRENLGANRQVGKSALWHDSLSTSSFV